jgi:hypothetical protein
MATGKDAGSDLMTKIIVKSNGTGVPREGMHHG